jgi:hypothetical protein
VLTWGAFRTQQPDLAEAGRGLSISDGLYAFIEPGPKRVDLVRDGRYAMHGFPPVNNEDAIECLLTRTTGHGDWNPQHTIWKASKVRAPAGESASPSRRA